jgi:hypothetical protein
MDGEKFVIVVVANTLIQCAIHITLLVLWHSYQEYRCAKNRLELLLKLQ